MCAITTAINKEITRLETRREKITSVLESEPELRIFEIQKAGVEILMGNNNGPEDVANKLQLLAEEEARLVKLMKFKYRNAKKYIRELTEIDQELFKLQFRLSKYSKAS